MNEEQKQAYLEEYKQEKEKGVKFYPDIIYKDLVVSFAIFLLLIGLAIFVTFGFRNLKKLASICKTGTVR